ncbi:hypothetical protein ABTB86_19805, partial [Acinetobacter baumannii]
MKIRLATARSTVAARCLMMSAVVALAAVSMPGCADAAAKQSRPAKITETMAPRNAGEPIMAIVSIKS